MEEDIRKQGALFLQQQRFGKKWKRVWCVLYRESSCSISRLEFFECKDGSSDKNDKSLRKQQEHKKVIRLSDCIRVSEVDMDGCPRETGPFLIETTEKIYVFAVDRLQLDDWTHKLCEIAFPMSWDQGPKRGSLQRGTRVDEDEGMEHNSLYSGREAVHDIRVCVRRTEASDRCRLKGDGFLRADTDALHLLDRSGDVLYTWPYRYLRRFGRDKSTFSFEAGRRCDSGEGGFEFDTKQGNFLFQVVEAAINLQRPQRQPSGGGQPSPPPTAQSRTPPPPPQLRGHVPQPPAAQAPDGVYSMVTEAPPLQMSHHRDKDSVAPTQPQQRPPLSRLEPPVDKLLTGVKSLTLEARGVPVPRKNQLKMISSCPLLHADPAQGPAPRPSPAPDQTYSQIGPPTSAERGTTRQKKGSGGGGGGGRGGGGGGGGSGGGGGGGGGGVPPEPEYSLPFDTIAMNVMSDIVNSQHARRLEPGADPLYDSIDEMKIRNIFSSAAAAAAGPHYEKVEHIYDEPEGCAAAAAQKPPGLLYDDPEEVRGDAWKVMGTPADPKGHEYPYNPRVDDYAVPQRAKRALPVTHSTNEEEEDAREEPQGEEQGEAQQEARRDSPYNNVMVKMV